MRFHSALLNLRPALISRFTDLKTVATTSRSFGAPSEWANGVLPNISPGLQGIIPLLQDGWLESMHLLLNRKATRK